MDALGLRSDVTSSTKTSLLQVGQGCRPDVDNNNFQDRTDRFAKQITVCNPCKDGVPIPLGGLGWVVEG